MTNKVAYVVDFDGTITDKDISNEICFYFGGAAYQPIKEAYIKKEITIRGWLEQIVTIFPADLDLMLGKAMQWAVLRNGLKKFLTRAKKKGSPVVVASDGLGFYIKPILSRFGLLDYFSAVYCNETLMEQNNMLGIKTPYAHKICSVCGNCKARHVTKLKEEGYAVIYVGDGENDRYGASWADKIYARDELADMCVKLSYDYTKWSDFNDLLKGENVEIIDRSQSSLCLPGKNGLKR